ncbi:hypothetical protein SAMN04488515_1163 [Cognatiyoonia koreensis]|uniref:Alpha/beta hydrolase family protein n=1 Tax=Cognatiyoonia koreensis TaxID=364200 RepID=A0A1I0PCV7_9RHOB|nr:hypothetical protein [Cognatiyoonia koreensis]SEW12250.1 hypothetical protein SAMN04488515_1163 [Cognatiyoonia koreensis]
MNAPQHGKVSKRRVFYIPGYDPIHPRRYRELYRKESAEQARISDYEIGIKPKQGGDLYGWHVDALIDEDYVQADIEVLVWSDIVRESMSGSIAGTYWQLVRTAWTYVASGALRRLMWLRKGPVIAALYPIGMLLLQLLIAIVSGAVLSSAVEWVLVRAGRFLNGMFGTGLERPVELADFNYVYALIGNLLVYAVWIGVTVFILRWFKSKDGRFFAYYLMHDYAFSARWKGANPPPLERRMSEFGEIIAIALQDDVDEVLVVGHSSGAHLAVSILSDLIRAGRVPTKGPKLAFLSLGQVVPMVSFLPSAKRLRNDLKFLCMQDTLTWVDVSAPGDGCSFALCDPVVVSGVAPQEGQKWPLIISAAFTQSLTPERWQELRWKFFRLHFQYLCAFDRPKDYDYFQITAGPLTLADRYRGRAPSKSRIDVPASKHTSIA